ncbi:hypothetical protein D3C72_1486550 [compost metagenome]
MRGTPTTSVRRSRSLAPFGVATVPSHCTLPLLEAIAISLPPGRPVMTRPSASTICDTLRKASDGPGRCTLQTRSPLLASNAWMR